MNTNQSQNVRRKDPLSGVEVLHVITTKPQYYHSVRIDQRNLRAVHVLPEKYQFCSVGSSSTTTNRAGPNTQQVFGSCTARVHYGLCTDFEVFLVNSDNSIPESPLPPPPQSLTSLSVRDSSTTSSLASPSTPTPAQVFTFNRISYQSKTPFIHSSDPDSATATTTTPGSSCPSSPLSPSDRTIVSRIESYRDNIGAALELLTDDEEPTELHDLIRNFVREDRRRQGGQQQSPKPQQQQSSSNGVGVVGSSAPSGGSTLDSDDLERRLFEAVTGDIDSKGHKILLKKSQADSILQKLQQQQQLLNNSNYNKKSLSRQMSNGGSTVPTNLQNGFSGGGETPFLSCSREGVVQSRMIRFGAQPVSHNSRDPSLVSSVDNSHSPSSSSVSSPSSSSSISLSKSSKCLIRANDGATVDSNASSKFNGVVNNHSSSGGGSIAASNTTTSNTSASDTSHKEKTVFGISPKSSSLSRYKSLIESRSGSSSPVNFAIGVELANINQYLGTPNTSQSQQPLIQHQPQLFQNVSSPEIDGPKYFGSPHRDTNSSPKAYSNPVSSSYSPSQSSSVNLESLSDVSATGSKLKKHKSKNRRELSLEIVAESNLDSSHHPLGASSPSPVSSPSSSSPSLRQKHSASSSPGTVSSTGASVIDSRKCIAVGSSVTGSRNSASSTRGGSSSTSPTSPSPSPSTTTTTTSSPAFPSPRPYLSANLSSTSSLPVSTSPAIQPQQCSSTSSVSSSPQSVTNKPDTESSVAGSHRNDPLFASNDTTNQRHSPFSSSSVSSSSSYSTTSAAPTVASPPASQASKLSQSNSVECVASSNTTAAPVSSSLPTNLSSNSIDIFIKENEKFFKSGNKLSRSISVIEDPDYGEELDPEEIDNMKIQQNKLSSLTDDEKALLHETLKVGLYGGTGDSKKRQQQMLNGDTPTNGLTKNDENGTSDNNNNNCDPNKPQLKPHRRIILVSKPVPKPEPKPEPKYVNGKVVFGQLPVKPVLQKGSVAERVMLFEKCPEKTSVTKNKLNELQRNRITNPNKIGHWIKSSSNSNSTNSSSSSVSSFASSTEKSTTNSQQSKQSESEIKSTRQASTNSRNNLNSGSHNNNNNKSSCPNSQQSISNGQEPKSPTSTIAAYRRFLRSNSLTGSVNDELPRFYYPNGRPYSSHEVETQIKKIISIFERFPSRTVTRKELSGVLKLVGIPVYWKEPLFRAVLNHAKNNPTNGTIGRRNSSRSNSLDMTNGGTLFANSKKEYISCEQFTDYWKKIISTCYDNASRFMKIITQGQRNYIIPEDFETLIQDVIDTHPGLLFLKEAEEFHSRYVHTVIARIFYCLDKTWSGTISLPELRKANFLKVLKLLEEEEDINQITEYFSYEHFYVIYCKFWELDTDHDLFISKYDLSRHNDSALSSRMIDQIFSGAVTRVPRNNDNTMSYAEFVWFLISEEDKRHPRAIEYWFRCMDVDGDGGLSMYELEYFYSEQVKRMEAAGIEALPFTDCLCQMIDLVCPKDPLRITLSDLKRCRLTPIFFDTFFNLEKYLDHEQRDPFASQRDEDGLSMSDWDRYAAEEYELLVAEENAQNGSNRCYSYYQPTVSFPSEVIVNEEFLSEEEYDEEDDEEEETDEDSMDQKLLVHSQNSLESSDATDSSTSSSGSCPSPENGPENSEAPTGDQTEYEEIVDFDSTAKATQKQICSNIGYNNDIEDIGKEFYDYVYQEFEQCPEGGQFRADRFDDKNLGKHPIILIERKPLRSTDFNNNNNNKSTFDDDDEFW